MWVKRGEGWDGESWVGLRVIGGVGPLKGVVKGLK